MFFRSRERRERYSNFTHSEYLKNIVALQYTICSALIQELDETNKCCLLILVPMWFSLIRRHVTVLYWAGGEGEGGKGGERENKSESKSGRERGRERGRENAGAGFLMILGNKGPMTKAKKLTALLRQNKKRNTKSKSILCHFRCWASMFVQHQTDPRWIFPCHTADPVHGGRFLPFGHIILLEKK